MIGYSELTTMMVLALGAAVGTYSLAAALAYKLNQFHFAHLAPERLSSLLARTLNSLFLFLAVSFFLVLIIANNINYESFNMFGMDFALFSQTIWNSMRGRLFASTIAVDAPILLGQRFPPILISVVPLYALLGDRSLIVLPALAAVAGAFPLYWFARKQLGYGLGFLITLMYFFSPAIQHVGLGQFYEIVLTLPLLMFATTFLLRRRYVPFLVCLSMALLCKEEVAFIAVGFGLYILVVQKQRFLGLSLTIASLLWGIVLLEFVIPYFHGGGVYYYFGGSALWKVDPYGYLGNNIIEIGHTLFLRPDVVAQHLLIPAKTGVVLTVLVIFGFFPFVGIEVSALALPTLAYTLLSDSYGQYELWVHHYDPIYPFFFLGTVIGVRRILHIIHGNPKTVARPRLALAMAIGIFLLVIGISAYTFLAPWPFKGFNGLSVHARDLEAGNLAKMIPENASVLTQSEIAPRVAQRKYIYIMTGIPCYGLADYLFADRARPWYGYREGAWTDVLSREYFETMVDKDDYILAKRVAPVNSLLASFGNRITLVGYTLNISATIQGGQSLRPIATWRVDDKMQSRYLVEIHVVDDTGHLWAADDREPGDGYCTTDQLDKGQTVSDQYDLKLPPFMPAGTYQLLISVVDKTTGEYLEATSRIGDSIGSDLRIASLPVSKNKGAFEASQLQIQQPFYVDMQEMRLLGYIPIRQTITPGELLNVGLYWKARGKPQGDYFAAVQLRKLAGENVFEHVARPAKGTYSTLEWNAGEVLLDWHDFELPRDIAPGEYQVVISLRDKANNRVLGEAEISAISIMR